MFQGLMVQLNAVRSYMDSQFEGLSVNKCSYSTVFSTYSDSVLNVFEV